MFITSKLQRETVFLLSVGTFLEYFDLMLYVHMAVLLNELFFPKVDHMVATILAAFAFSSTFILRPFGGLIIGWIGDRIGRKHTIIITTTIMAFCCFIMAILPTYAEIGIMASIIMICCRALQGLSSLGEIVGAKLYMSESFKQPQRYAYSNCIALSSMLGGGLALTIAIISSYTSWRYGFMAGMVIAIIGIVARVRLRETPEFVDHKRRIKIYKESLNYKDDVKASDSMTKVDKKMVFAYFSIRFMLSICFYSTYIYSTFIAKSFLEMSGNEVLGQNLKVNLLGCLVSFGTIILVRKYHPLKVAQFSALLVLIFLFFIPCILQNININLLLAIQFMFGFIMFVNEGLETVCFKHFSIRYRFTLAASTFGVAAAFSFSAIPFIIEIGKEYLGYYIIWTIYGLGILSFLWAIGYIKKLEKSFGVYDHYPNIRINDSNVELNSNSIVKTNSGYYESSIIDCEYGKHLLNKLEEINQGIDNKIDLEAVKRAMAFAKKWHSGQLRKSGECFYTHPFAVAQIVSDFLPKTHVIVAALLHDILEDTECNIELIEQEFTTQIAVMVQNLSRCTYKQKGEKLAIGELILNMKKQKNYEVILIKIIDRLHNLHTLEGLKLNKRIEFVRETIEYIIDEIQYGVDNLNIDNKIDLENEIMEHCYKLLKKHS